MHVNGTHEIQNTDFTQGLLLEFITTMVERVKHLDPRVILWLREALSICLVCLQFLVSSPRQGGEGLIV